MGRLYKSLFPISPIVEGCVAEGGFWSLLDESHINAPQKTTAIKIFQEKWQQSYFKGQNRN